MRHALRNPSKVRRDPVRDYIRDHLPSGPDGLVSEDLDLVLLRWGALAGRPREADGLFKLVEKKERAADFSLGYAQERVFGLLDRICRGGDPEGRHYEGFYKLAWGLEWPDDANDRQRVIALEEVVSELSARLDEAQKTLFALYRVRPVINGAEVTIDQFEEWCLGRLSIEPLWKRNVRRDD